jgi:hypothetical protein
VSVFRFSAEAHQSLTTENSPYALMTGIIIAGICIQGKDYGKVS